MYVYVIYVHCIFRRFWFAESAELSKLLFSTLHQRQDPAMPAIRSAPWQPGKTNQTSPHALVGRLELEG